MHHPGASRHPSSYEEGNKTYHPARFAGTPPHLRRGKSPG